MKQAGIYVNDVYCGILTEDELQEDIIDDCPAPVIEEMEHFPSAEAAASGDLPW